ncbi:MAG: hypothetical protein LIO70_01795, partial [Clostridiales bacterium]|nr:hypothetical protein [Clostridiales bacterium]
LTAQKQWDFFAAKRLTALLLRGIVILPVSKGFLFVRIFTHEGAPAGRIRCAIAGRQRFCRTFL